MTNPLQSFLKLSQNGGHMLASDLRHAVGERAFAALLAARLLEPGPPATTYHCPKALGMCSRRVIPYDGHGPYDVVAVPPKGLVCCEPQYLVRDDIRTVGASTHALAAMIAGWLNVKMSPSLQLESASAVVLGQLERFSPPRRVFFARSFAGGDTMGWLADLGRHEAAVVLLPTRPIDFSEALRSGKGRSTILFLEDYLHVDDSRVRLRALSTEVFTPSNGGTARSNSFCRVITEAGSRDVGSDEYDELHASRHEYDLFLDTSMPVRGGFSGNRRHGQTVETFELSIHEAAMLLELIRANGRALTPERMRCVQEANISDPMRKARDLRRKADFRLGRDRFRVLQSHTNGAGLVAQFSFRSPANFKFVILVALTDEPELPAAVR